MNKRGSPHEPTAQQYALGEELRDLVVKRTGVAPSRLVCPREKSDMTPCVVRDGYLCVVLDGYKRAICVGCEANVEQLVVAERAKARP